MTLLYVAGSVDTGPPVSPLYGLVALNMCNGGWVPGIMCELLSDNALSDFDPPKLGEGVTRYTPVPTTAFMLKGRAGIA